mgnify:FL=1
MSVKIFHCADTHLGYRAYNKLVPENKHDAGLNQREADIYASWNNLVEAALQEKPDVFIHAGDLFDRVRPSNMAISKAREGLYRLSEANIPTIVVAGNHETPRIARTGHVFQLLTRIPNVHVMYSGEPETVLIKNVMITGVAHSSTLAENVSSAEPDPEYECNILITHGSISGAGIKIFENNELNQTTLPLHIFEKEWDYVALGHYHDFTEVKENMYYSGSPERLSFGDANSSKGYAIIELPEMNVIPKQIECREFVNLNCDFQSFQDDDLTTNLIKIVEECNPEAKIVRLAIANLTVEAWNTIDRRALHKASKKAVNFSIIPDLEEKSHITASGSDIGSLIEEFRQFMNETGFDDLGKEEKKRVMERAEEVLG